MKKIILLSVFKILLIYSAFAQFEIVEPNGNDGVGINLINSNGYNWYITSESTNWWGHTNTLNFHPNNETILFQLFPDYHANINGRLDLDFYSRMHVTDIGMDGQANGFDFNSGSTITGFLVEQRKSESSGFYCDGDFAVIYSPGDQNRLLRVYDEDGMIEKWYIDGSGYANTISDERSKENIRDVSNCLNQLSNLEAKKYNYKKEYDNNVETSLKDVPENIDGTYPGGDIVADNNKYDPSQKEYYGFIAQDVELIFPEIVSEDEKGNKFVSYTQFIPIIIEGMKEQQSVIEEQQNKIDILTKQVEALEKRMDLLSAIK
jgi:hypothetical protein